MRRLYGNTYTAGRQRSRQLAHHRFDTDVLGRLLVFRSLEAFGTISTGAAVTASTLRGSLPSDAKKLPTRLLPHREAVKRYRSSLYKMAATSRTSRASTRSLKSNSIKHLLSLKVARSPQKLRASFVLADEQPRKEAPPVYMETA